MEGGFGFCFARALILPAQVIRLNVTDEFSDTLQIAFFISGDHRLNRGFQSRLAANFQRPAHLQQLGADHVAQRVNLRYLGKIGLFNRRPEPHEIPVGIRTRSLIGFQIGFLPSE